MSSERITAEAQVARLPRQPPNAGREVRAMAYAWGERRESGPDWTTESRPSMIWRATPNNGVTRGRLFFERAAGSVQFHSSRLISPAQSPLIFGHPSKVAASRCP